MFVAVNGCFVVDEWRCFLMIDNMNQYSYSIGFLDSDLQPVYPDTVLTVSLDISNIETQINAAVINGPSFGELLLSIVEGGSSSFWSPTGQNSKATVESSTIVPTDQPLNEPPKRLFGTMEVNGAELYLFGTLDATSVGEAQSAAGEAQSEAMADHAEVAEVGSKPVEYNSNLILLNNKLEQTGDTAELHATGSTIRIGVIPRFSVSGTLKIKGETVDVRGYGNEFDWRVSAEDISKRLSLQVLTTFSDPGGKLVGMITRDGKMSWVVGEPLES